MILLSSYIFSTTFFGVAIASINPTTSAEVPIATPAQREPTNIVDLNEPICYMRMEDGRVLDLTRLCGGGRTTQTAPGVAAQPSFVDSEPRDE